MNSLAFLIFRSAKNSLLEILRKPAKLALYLLVIGGIAGIVIVSFFSRQSVDGFADILWLKGILFLFILLFCGIAIQKGLSNGDIIFDMNDVNMLFVSPVSPKKILLYGLLRMAKMSFLAGFFILFQSNSLGVGFGVGFDALLIILFCFTVAVTLLSILSLVIYSITNGRPVRKRIVRLIAVAMILPILIVAITGYAKTGDVLRAMEAALHSPIFSWTPVAGWAAEAAVSLITGNIGSGLLFLGVFALASALLLLYIVLGKADYYEDVLVATESAFEKKRAMAEGQIQAVPANGRKIKVAKTGIRGSGSNTLFFMHLRQSLRVNPIGILDWTSVWTILGTWVVSFFLRGNEGIILILQILMWMQIYLIGMGRGLKELYLPYIYLIPESSFSKIVWSNLEPAAKVLVESVLIFVGAGLFTQEPLIMIIAAIMVYTLFSLLLISINYLSMRWTGADISGGLLIFLYTIAVILIMLPGIVLAMVVGFSIGGVWGAAVGLGILAAWELIATLVFFALSKGVLHRCDLPTVGLYK